MPHRCSRIGGVDLLLTGKPLYQAMTCSEAILQAARGASLFQATPAARCTPTVGRRLSQGAVRDPQDRFRHGRGVGDCPSESDAPASLARVAVLTGSPRCAGRGLAHRTTLSNTERIRCELTGRRWR